VIFIFLKESAGWSGSDPANRSLINFGWRWNQIDDLPTLLSGGFRFRGTFGHHAWIILIRSRMAANFPGCSEYAEQRLEILQEIRLIRSLAQLFQNRLDFAKTKRCSPFASLNICSAMAPLFTSDAAMSQYEIPSAHIRCDRPSSLPCTRRRFAD